MIYCVVCVCEYVHVMMNIDDECEEVAAKMLRASE